MFEYMNDTKEEKRYKLIFDRKNCIGAGPCAAVSPSQWYLDEGDGRKAHVAGGQKNEQTQEETKEFGDVELEEHMNAAISCPVQVIHIYDLKRKKKLV